MSVRPIVLSDNPILHQKSHRVKRFGSALQQLAADMVETMHAANGAGLAAIQIGELERVIAVQVPEDDENVEEGKLYVVVNPELARTSREMEEGIEGCLSIPGWVGEVERHYAVTVKGKDLDGKAVRIRAQGMLARAFQHEIDHTNGILFIDHIEDPEKIWPVPEGEEEAAEAAQEVPGGVASSGPLE